MRRRRHPTKLSPSSPSQDLQVYQFSARSELIYPFSDSQKSRFSTEFFFLFFCDFFNFSFENLEISLRSTRYRRRNPKFRRYRRQRAPPSCTFAQHFLYIFEFLLQFSRSQGGSVFPLAHTGQVVTLKYTVNHSLLFIDTVFKST